MYSGAIANNPGTNFLRGAQRTNANGVATFQTIYPGWYPGRAVHIHVKVHVGGAVVHTGQLFFPAAITNAVYKTAPYKSHGAHPDTTNASDAIYRNGGDKGVVKLTRQRRRLRRRRPTGERSSSEADARAKTDRRRGRPPHPGGGERISVGALASGCRSSKNRIIAPE